ncbi:MULTISPECIES: class I SAM-dependent methyltransferase [unclassified Micromonospora]|uniref:class I SAM-dependent methyltransferase n=1 Tax=unclassified Micromonospora TaxID=2617518 RepID=UPI001C249323|nr:MULTISPECIES: class I SAM-dependent methyltransferase [unclassified Micromonospora]MBU8860262.1 class I SAM-dependent methyltransferase [Micromonospora sp. WMMB482]MDM4779795.1 class I SAM-dependent methyltransferase [Micromonospora sp. b486]
MTFSTAPGYGFADAWHAVAGGEPEYTGPLDPDVSRMLASYIGPGETVLDIAADDFAAVAARAGAHVTVVDPSPGRLARVADDARRYGVTVETVRALWPHTALPHHDVVVSVGTLRRHHDLPAALRAMVLHAGRLLLCADEAGAPAPHEQVLTALLGAPVTRPVPRHLLIAGTLAELGLTADVRTVTAVRGVTGADEAELAARVAGRTLPGPLAARLLDLLAPMLSRTPSGHWQYRYPAQLGLVVCPV